jgi:hypothetical protein
MFSRLGRNGWFDLLTRRPRTATPTDVDLYCIENSRSIRPRCVRAKGISKERQVPGHVLHALPATRKPRAANESVSIDSSNIKPLLLAAATRARWSLRCGFRSITLRLLPEIHDAVSIPILESFRMSDNEKASISDLREGAKTQGWSAYFVCDMTAVDGLSLIC